MHFSGGGHQGKLDFLILYANYAFRSVKRLIEAGEKIRAAQKWKYAVLVFDTACMCVFEAMSRQTSSCEITFRVNYP